MTTLLMWWREWCVVTLFGVKRSRDKIRKLLRYDTILQNWRKRKQCNYHGKVHTKLGPENFRSKYQLFASSTVWNHANFCWKLNHFLDIWSTEEKLSNPLFPLNNSDKGGKISVGIFMRVKSLRTRRVGNFFCHFNFYYLATINGNKLLIFAYWTCI